MQTSSLGYAFIKQNEGFAAHIYEDNGHSAIGYGHDIQLGDPDFSAGITQSEAEALLEKDVSTRYEPTLNKWLADHSVSATQNQFDALIDFAYNLGTGNLLLLLIHPWAEVPSKIPLYDDVNHKPSAGLLARRNAEVQLFSTPEQEAA